MRLWNCLIIPNLWAIRHKCAARVPFQAPWSPHSYHSDTLNNKREFVHCEALANRIGQWRSLARLYKQLELPEHVLDFISQVLQLCASIAGCKFTKEMCVDLFRYPFGLCKQFSGLLMLIFGLLMLFSDLSKIFSCFSRKYSRISLKCLFYQIDFLDIPCNKTPHYPCYMRWDF